MKFTRTLSDWRFYIFVFLIVAAPLSKYPSFSMPLFNFSSFRLGLYQIAAVVFVLLCIKPVFLAGVSFFSKSHKYAFGALVILGVLALTSIAWSLYPARSALLGVSFALLIAIVLCAWWYTARQLSKVHWHIILQSMLYAAVFFGVVGTMQLIFFSFSNQTLGILCSGCSADIFGFPRINGFAAEPQFFANALLPFVFASLFAVVKAPTRLAWAALFLSFMTIGLTFSRGAYFAVAIALVATMLALYFKKIIRIKTIFKITAVCAVAIFLALSMLTISASVRYKNTPNITYETIDSIFEHLTLGVINLPEKTVVIIQSTPDTPSTTTPPNQTEDFVSPGLIESSGNERLGAAELALKAWQYNPLIILFGVGIGNLGPFVVQNIDTTAPDNLTVYIYYILLVSELGIVGLSMFSISFGATIWRLLKRSTLASFCIAGGLFAFLLQFFFFGSYINVVYIWLWLGIALGVATSLNSKKTKVKKV